MIRCRFPGRTADSLPLYKTGSSVINYTYNADGVRIGKSGSRAGTFIVSGTQILREINSVATIDYLYDENGSPIGLTYKGTTYYYRKNLQGDIINITDSTGAKVVTYTYNAWGKIMSMTGNMELAVNNPFRYRGYYYDVESGLYYLNSRYYDPQTGRFINAEPNVDYGKFDEGAGLNGYNVFAYCANNPVMFKDDSGEFVISISIGIGSLLTWAAYGIATAVGVGAGVAIGTEIYNRSRTIQFSLPTQSTRSKILKDTKYKIPPNKVGVYQLAYINNRGTLVKLSKKYTFTEAMILLGFAKMTKTGYVKISDPKPNASKAKQMIISAPANTKDWGIYTNSQQYAKYLALATGCNAQPEVHSSGMYGHYHDSQHKIHIWYGGMLNY